MSDSGKRDYFRHSAMAHEDNFILELEDKFGPWGYRAWFVLMEKCTKKRSVTDGWTFTFHASDLRKSLKCSTKKLNQFLIYSKDRLKIDYILVEHSYSVNVSNLPKYLGKYGGNTPLNKIKENKIKENKINKESCTPSGAGDSFFGLSEIDSWLGPVTQSMQKNWTEQYDFDSMVEQATEAMAWEVAQKKRKKSKPLFLNNWFKRTAKPKIDPLEKFFLDSLTQEEKDERE